MQLRAENHVMDMLYQTMYSNLGSLRWHRCLLLRAGNCRSARSHPNSLKKESGFDKEQHAASVHEMLDNESLDSSR